MKRDDLIKLDVQIGLVNATLEGLRLRAGDLGVRDRGVPAALRRASEEIATARSLLESEIEAAS